MPQTPAIIPSARGPAPVQTITEGETLMRHLTDVMEQLLRVLDEETALVRAGRLSEVGRLEAGKAELSQLYLRDAARVKASAAYLANELSEQFNALRTRHDTFHAVLQINLAVLATAHAVSEGIIRGVAGEFTRKAAPQTYGVTGRASAPSTRVAQPMALSRTL